MDSIYVVMPAYNEEQTIRDGAGHTLTIWSCSWRRQI